MGYHLIDILYWYFGIPNLIYSVAAPQKDKDAKIDVEETTLTCFSYENGMIGSLFLSLCEPDKHEELSVYGQRGYIKLDRNCLKRFDAQGKLVESMTREPPWPSGVSDVLLNVINNLSNPNIVFEECRSGLERAIIIESIYKALNSKTPVNPRELDK